MRSDATDTETRLWRRLRNRQLDGYKFRRQVPIDRFIVDFLCESAKVIVELDGGQHADRTERDAVRTEVLEISGYVLVRFWNNDVLSNTEGVLEEILSALRTASGAR